MNVLSTAPAAAPRTRATSPPSPATAGDDFATLLAGLGPDAPPAAAVPAEPVHAPTDQPLPDGTASGHCTPDAAVLVAVAPPAVAAEASAVEHTSHAVPGSAPPAPTGSPTPPVAAAPAPGGCAPVPVEAGSTSATGGPATAVRPDPPRLTGPSTAGPAQAAPATSVEGTATTATTTAAATTAGTAATTAAAATAGTAGTAGTAPPAGPTPAAPDAVELSVPAEVAGDGPVPVLDARSTVSPVAPATAAQTAGSAVVEAVLPSDADGAAPAAAPADAPRPDVTPTGSTPAPAAMPVAAGAEAGISGPSAADPRAATPAAPAPAAPPPPPPAVQVAQLLGPVLAGPDGTYSLSLQLYPEELGAVQVEVLLRGGEIRLAMHAPDEAAQAALRAALPDLRADLHAGGLSATSLSVDDGRSGQSSLDRQDDRAAGRRPDGQDGSPGRRPVPYGAAEPAPRTPTSHADTALDLRM